jgi:signal transduction histidine kinase/CheY-like chemotaxis protein
MSKKQIYSRLDDLFSNLGEKEPPVPVFQAKILPGWTWECDSEGVIASCSSEIQESLGYLPSELVGQSLLSYGLHPQSKVLLSDAMQQELYPMEINALYLSRQNKWINVRVSVLGRTSDGGKKTGWHGFSQVLGEASDIVASPPSLPLKGLEPVFPPKTAPLSSLPGVAYQEGEFVTPSGMWTQSAKQSYNSKKLISQPAQTGEPAVIVAPFQMSQQGPGLVEIVDNTSLRKWSEDEKLLVQDVANQLAMALDNAQLYTTVQQELAERTKAEKEILRRTQDLATINTIGQQLSKLAGREEIFELIYQAVGQLVDNRNMMIAVLSQENKTISYPIYTIDGVKKSVANTLIGNGIPEHTFLFKVSILINTDVKNTLIEKGIDLPERIPCSLLAIPLGISERNTAALILQDFNQENAYSSIHIELLSTIAAQATTALDNANLFQEIRNALTAIENRERYQSSVARSVAILTEFGTKSIPEVLETLGNAAQCSRVYYAQVQENEEGSYWRSVAQWQNPDSPVEFDQLKTKHMPVQLFPYWVKELRENGFSAGSVDELPSPEKELIQEQNISSILLLAVQGKATVPGFLAFEQVGPVRKWMPDEINGLRVAADGISNTIIREDLLEKLQSSLDETESLYNASHRLALANDMQEMVAAIAMGLRAPSINRAVLMLFDHDPSGKLSSIHIAANWYSGRGTPPPSIGTEYYGEISESFFLSSSPNFIDDISDANLDKSLLEVFERENIHSAGILPLWASKRQIGFFMLEAEERHQFSPREVRSYPPLVDQMAIAIENMRLFEQTEAALAETGLLYKISSGIAQASTPQDLIILAANNILPSRADQALILQVSQEINGEPTELEVVGYYDALDEYQRIGTRISLTSLPIIKNLYEEVDVYPDLGASHIDRESKRTLMHLDMKSACLTPFHSAGRLTGLMIVSARMPTEFKPEEARLLHIAGNSIAIALEKQRLLRDSQRRALELQSAAEIARDTTKTLSFDALLSGIVNLVVQRFGFNHAGIFLLDDTGKYAIIQEATGEAGRQMKLQGFRLATGSKSIIGTVTGSGIPMMVNDTSQSILYYADPLLPDTKSELAVPLKLGERIIGALDIQANRQNAFSQDDITVFQILADQIAVAIDNARAYELSQKAIAEMKEVDRLKSQFLANMSHELRTPLNSIIGFSRVILKGIDGVVNDVQKQDLLAIYNSGQHLLNLINDILDLSKIEAGKMELSFSEVNLSDTINSVMTTAIGLVKDKPIQLLHKVPADLPTIQADSTRIRQVLLNLISNAAKFTDEGSITVEAMVSTNGVDTPEIMITVTDTGMGVSDEDQVKLFQPFSQVDDSPTRKTGGTGLGLSICRSLIELHGGRIGLLSSEVGKGSVFYFTLPMVIPTPAPEATSPGTNAVLAIDDDYQVISLYERFLKPQGIQVIPCTDSKQAVQRAREIKPFAITLDIMMPEKDGWEVMQDLKNDPDTRHIPVIICSILEEEEKGFSLGAADYLVKPFLQDDLTNAISRLDYDDEIRDVLVVDDDPDDLRLIQKILANETSFRVTLAEGGQKGWEEIREKCPDIIILDLFMPDMNGFALLDKLRTDPKLSEIPVIVLSGADLTPDQYKQLTEFSKNLLTKSLLRENELLNTIESNLIRLRRDSAKRN